LSKGFNATAQDTLTLNFETDTSLITTRFLFDVGGKLFAPSQTASFTLFTSPSQKLLKAEQNSLTISGLGTGVPTSSQSLTNFAPSPLLANASSGQSGVFNPNTTSTNIVYTFSTTGTKRIRGASTDYSSVPGPLPILGVAAAFGFSRRLRRRIKSSATF